jgi:hypothetical protein
MGSFTVVLGRLRRVLLIIRLAFCEHSCKLPRDFLKEEGLGPMTQ